MKNPDWIFECKKCGHNLYIGKEEMDKMHALKNCINCGEETPTYIFIGEGNYDHVYHK